MRLVLFGRDLEGVDLWLEGERSEKRKGELILSFYRVELGMLEAQARARVCGVGYSVRCGGGWVSVRIGDEVDILLFGRLGGRFIPA